MILQRLISKAVMIPVAAIVFGTIAPAAAPAQKYLGRVQIGPNGVSSSNYNQNGYGRSGHVQRQNGGYNGSYQQRSSAGQRSGYLQQNGGNFRAGYAQSNRSGHGTSGHVQRQNGRTSGAFSQSNRQGRQSGYAHHQGGNFGAGYSQSDWRGNGRSGSISHGRNGTRMQGSRSNTGPIPGTVQRQYGDVQLNGRNSRVTAGSELRTMNGIELGSSSGTVSGRGISRRESVGSGPARVSREERLRFQGLNSEYTTRHEAQAGPARGSAQGSVSRRGAHASGSIGVGKARASGSAKISTSGSEFRVGGTSIKF